MPPYFSPLRLLAFVAGSTLPFGFAASSFAELLTFEVRGKIIDEVDPDFRKGDAFIATYTFNPSVAEDENNYDPEDNWYDAIQEWRFTFDSGFAFASLGPDAGRIMLSNNHSDAAGGYDRYLVHLDSELVIAPALPSGRQVGYIQFYIDGYSPVGNPDLLSDTLLSTTPPPIQLGSPFGRFVFEGVPDQPFFAIDSVTIVPEPSVAQCFLSVALAIAVNRRSGFRRSSTAECTPQRRVASTLPP
jgi:hypothetical protein